MIEKIWGFLKRMIDKITGRDKKSSVSPSKSPSMSPSPSPSVIYSNSSSASPSVSPSQEENFTSSSQSPSFSPSVGQQNYLQKQDGEIINSENSEKMET